MTKLRPRKPSAPMVVALIALFVAMGGTSYAAVTLGKNSVGSKQLKKNAVTTSKIKNGAVTTSKIKNGAVTAAKINPAGLTVPNADNAGSAGAVNGNGIKGVQLAVATSSTATIFSGDGLTLTAVATLPTTSVSQRRAATQMPSSTGSASTVAPCSNT